MKAIFLISLFAIGCIEAPPSNISQPDSGTPDMMVEDMASPDVAGEDMSDPNNVVDIGTPDADPDLPVQDMSEDLPSTNPEPFERTLVAPGTTSPQTEIPLWIRFDAEELENYQINRAIIDAGGAAAVVPTELTILRPNAGEIGFWAKWPFLANDETMLPVRFEPGLPVADPELWSEFEHVWHLRSTQNIPSAKGGVDLTADPVGPNLGLIIPVLRGYAEAENVEVGQNFTITFWFRHADQDNSTVRLLGLNELGTTPEFRLELVGDRLKMIQGEVERLHEGTPLAADQFHHIALVRKAGGVEIRVNGEIWGVNPGPPNTARSSSFSVKLGESGKSIAFAELWMTDGEINVDRTRLFYRNQSQAFGGSANEFVVDAVGDSAP